MQSIATCVVCSIVCVPVCLSVYWASQPLVSCGAGFPIPHLPPPRCLWHLGSAALAPQLHIPHCKFLDTFCMPRSSSYKFMTEHIFRGRTYFNSPLSTNKFKYKNESKVFKMKFFSIVYPVHKLLVFLS